MQKNNVIAARNAPLMFSGFCKDAASLSVGTPLFMTDDRGRVVAQKHLPKRNTMFLTMGEFLDDGEFLQYLSRKTESDSFVVRAKNSFYPKSYIAVTNMGGGLFSGVVCSYCEENCKDLKEYFDKLNLNRDYLSSFFDGGASYAHAVKAFDGRILAVGSLLRFPHGSKEKKKLPLTLKNILEKLSTFSQKLYALSTSRCSISVLGENPVVMVSPDFVNAAVFCLALSLRNSVDGCVKVNINDTDKKLVRVRMASRTCEKAKNDMYRGAVEDAVREHCENIEIYESNGEYIIDLVLEKAQEQKLVVSEMGFADKEADRMLSEQLLFDIFNAIADI